MKEESRTYNFTIKDCSEGEEFLNVTVNYFIDSTGNPKLFNTVSINLRPTLISCGPIDSTLDAGAFLGLNESDAGGGYSMLNTSQTSASVMTYSFDNNTSLFNISDFKLK